MKKEGFWTKDWFFGLLVSLVLFVLSITFARGFFESLETKAYDWGVIATSKPPSDKVAVIAIDDQSIANIGRWPWPRDVHAAMIDKLAGAKASAIGSTVFFFEPQIDPGLQYINKLIELYNKNAQPEPAPAEPAPAAPGKAAPAKPAAPAMPAAPSASLQQFASILAEAEETLNTDRRLAESMKKAGNVIIPSYFDADYNPPAGKPDKPLPDYVAKFALSGVAPGAGDFMYADPNAAYPIAEVGSVAAGIGHLAVKPDADGGARRDITVINYDGQMYPSLPLMVAARSLNLSAKDIKVSPGESVSLGNLRIVTDDRGMMYPYFYKPVNDRPAMPEDSFFDVISGKIPADKYKGKVVLIGATAAGVGSQQVTPVGNLAPVQKMAHSVSSILQQQFFRTPSWGLWVKLLTYVLIAVYLIVLLPRLRAGPAALISLGVLVLLMVVHFGLMVGPGIWVQLMLPASLLVLGHLLLTTKRFLVTERGKEQADAAGAESNRMLGLAFQQQGQLDMAFDKFRKCPVDEQLLENIYSLALDFERRRQFNKAESAFAYINQHDPKFKDVADRMNRAKAMSETIILGGSAAARSNAATMVLSGSGEKPKLGR
ncbi:MAG TPA: CHASE2 domain-containing protein, partial [Usitatibacteraceae bacterium]|nr:CHASE2 domain-containing protein [Usitatibacteraceae bacterium]